MLPKLKHGNKDYPPTKLPNRKLELFFLSALLLVCDEPSGQGKNRPWLFTWIRNSTQPVPLEAGFRRCESSPLLASGACAYLYFWANSHNHWHDFLKIQKLKPDFITFSSSFKKDNIFWLKISKKFWDHVISQMKII